MKTITPVALLFALAAPLAAAPIANGPVPFYDFDSLGSGSGGADYLRDDFIGPRTEKQQAEYEASKQQQSFGVTDPCVPWRIPCKLPEENKPDLKRDGAIPNDPGENWVEHKDANGKTVWNRCTATMCEVQSQSCEANPNIKPCKAQEEQRKLAEKIKEQEEQEKRNNTAYGWTGGDNSKSKTPGNEKKSGGFSPMGLGLGGGNEKSTIGAPAPGEDSTASAEDKNKDPMSLFGNDGADGDGLADNDAGDSSGPDAKSIVDDMENGTPPGSLFQPRAEGEKGLGDLGGVSALFNPTDNGNAVAVGGPGGGWAPTEKTSAIATLSTLQKPIGAQDNSVIGRVMTWMQRFDKAGAPAQLRDDLVRPDYRNSNSFGTRPKSAGPAPSDG